MSFESSFMHTIISQSLPDPATTLSALLPPAIPYSPEAAEHLTYLKAAGHTAFPANTRFTQQNFHSYLLIYTHLGNATLQYGEGLYSITPDTLLFIDCRKTYTLHCASLWQLDALFFEGYSVPYYYDLFRALAPPVLPLPKGSPFPQLFHRIAMQNFTHPELVNAKLLTEILTHLLCMCQDARGESSVPGWLLKLKDSLDASFSEPFSLEDISQNVHINKYQICRDFKKHFRITPLQYVNHLRLEHARELLEISSFTINEICWRVGFENVNYFIQLFKREYGTTPAAYRKRFFISHPK